MRRFFAAIACAAVLFLGGCSTASHSDNPSAVCINEVQTSGGEYDWIELYNSGDEAISLDGCYLSDDLDEPGKWQFPSVTLEAGAYLLLYADDNPKAGSFHLPFRLSAKGTALLFSQHSGAVIQQLDIPASASGLSYGRHENGYTWYASPTPAADNHNGMILGEETTLLSEGLRINEYMSRNRSVLYDANGDYSDWIELHNFSDRIIDLSGYTLTDARTDAVKWQFPSGTVLAPNAYLIVRCSGRNTATDGGELHTNFKLGNDDSFIGLYTASGTFCCGITYRPTEQNYSCGYLENHGYVSLRYPTPGYTNTPSIANEVTK